MIFGCLKEFCSPQLEKHLAEKRIKAKSCSKRVRPRRLVLLPQPAAGRGAAAGKPELSCRAPAEERDSGQAGLPSQGSNKSACNNTGMARGKPVSSLVCLACALSMGCKATPWDNFFRVFFFPFRDAQVAGH